MEDEDNISYVSTLTVAFAHNPQQKVEYVIGPFNTTKQLRYHCKFLLTYLYQSYPASTSLTKLVQEINEQEGPEAAAEFDLSYNILYLIPWISLATAEPIKQATLQKQNTTIVAKITNNHELVFFIRQTIDHYNKLEVGLICPEVSKLYVMHGFVEAIRAVGSLLNITNLVIAEPLVDMVYIDELVCPKHLPDQEAATGTDFYRVQRPAKNLTAAAAAVPDDEWDNVLQQLDTPPAAELRPISPLLFSSIRSVEATPPTFRRTLTSAVRL